MGNAQQLIRQFSEVPAEDKESEEKIDILLELEDVQEEEIVIPFFLSIVSNEKEYDQARIEALKILKLRNYEDEGLREKTGTTVLQVLQTSKDPDVRNYAAMALAAFMDMPNISKAISAMIADPAIKNPILRHNLLACIERGGKNPASEKLLKTLAKDKELGASAKRILSEDWA